jgi:hypothetical protein
MTTTTTMGDATVTRSSGVSAEEYAIRGTLDSVQETIKALFERYPAEGYGTFVHSISKREGQYIARMSRSKTCE